MSFIEEFFVPTWKDFGWNSKQIEQQTKWHYQEIKIHQQITRKCIKVFSKKKLKVLIIDLAQGGYNSGLTSSDLNQSFIDTLFGGKKEFSSLWVNILGFNQLNSINLTYDIWLADRESFNFEISNYNFWICTGGPAMPSELDNNTNPNFVWLSKVAQILSLLQKNNIPGLAICLGHQLFAYNNNSKIGKIESLPEFGSVKHFSPNSKKVYEFCATHFESVLTKPKGSKVLLQNQYNNFQCLEYKLENNNKIITIQNHLEIPSYYLELLRMIRSKINPELKSFMFSKRLRPSYASKFLLPKIFEILTKPITS
jgi:GMP synthase-like glutamine amidotransferase